MDKQRRKELRLVHRYLTSLSLYPTAISPERREHIIEIIRRELPPMPIKIVGEEDY